MAENCHLTEVVTADAADRGSDKKRQQPPAREFWPGQLGFLLTVMGYNIGLGNVLRFPYLVMKNGGGAFLIPYFVFLVTIGIPLFMLELPLGQYSGKSAVTFFKSFCPLLTGIGWCNVVMCFFFNIYYLVLMSWICFYLVHSFFNPLPWSGCDPAWGNGSSCFWTNLTAANSSEDYATDMDIDLLRSENCSAFAADRRSPTELFFERNLLGLTSGIHDLGEIRWELVVCLVVSWICVYLCLIKGVQSLGKVVYVTALGPYLFLLVLLVRGLTLPGGWHGILYYLTPDWERLATPAPWVEAAQQIFWSLGPTWGCTICMASHNRFRNNIYRDSLLLPLMCALTSFFAGFVTFSFVGDLAVRTGRPVPCVLKAGLSLAFVVYLTAFDSLPLPQLWAVVFFVLLILLALDSSVSTFEANRILYNAKTA
uniref:Transporter n=2 Tax=Macrostomum lignano TaxID=282301 RepID=A0A1I8I3A5_9PLAT